jgi:hypothetical protein
LFFIPSLEHDHHKAVRVHALTGEVHQLGVVQVLGLVGNPLISDPISTKYISLTFECFRIQMQPDNHSPSKCKDITLILASEKPITMGQDLLANNNCRCSHFGSFCAVCFGSLLILGSGRKA